mgnify:CR=1 FL=1
MATFTLPELPYADNALEPYIDAQTMEIHHGKHHAAYVSNLNAALEKAPRLQNASLEPLLSYLKAWWNVVDWERAEQYFLEASR